MTEVTRGLCWHQNFGPNELSAPAQGLRLNSFSSITADLTYPQHSSEPYRTNGPLVLDFRTIKSWLSSPTVLAPWRHSAAMISFLTKLSVLTSRTLVSTERYRTCWEQRKFVFLSSCNITSRGELLQCTLTFPAMNHKEEHLVVNL